MTLYYVSTTGSDSNNGTSRSTPFLTVQKGCDSCVAGDTLTVLSGTYTCNFSSTTGVNVFRSGTSGSPITLQSDVLWGAKIVSSANTDAFKSTGNYVNIIGFDVSDPSAINGIKSDGSNCSIKQNHVHDICNSVCGTGAGIIHSNFSGSDNDVIGNWIHHIGPSSSCNTEHGIYYTNLRGHCWNNIIFDVCSYGIHLYHCANNLTISSNLVFGCRKGGILVGNDGLGPGSTTNDNTIVSNNIVIYTSGYGIQEFGSNTGTHNQFLNNCVFGNSNLPYHILTSPAPTGTVSADPYLSNYQSDGSGDYHLLPGSPCANAGTSTGAPSTDYDGKARPYGGAYDIGPYELTPSSLTIVLAGKGISAYVQEETIKITDTLGQGAGVGGGSAGRASTCSFLTSLGPAASAVGAGTSVSSPQLVREGEISIYDSTGTKIFGGFVGKMDDKTEKTRVYTQVDCYDYYQQLDRYQVQKLYTGASDVYMIRDLLTTYAPWVDISGLPTLGNYTFTVRNFKAVTLQKVIAQITDITGFQFWIDAYKKAHYVTPMQSQTAPFSLSTSPDFVNSFQSKVTSFTTDDNAAINRVTFQGGKRASDNFTQDLSTQANGSNKLFVLAFYPRKDSLGTITVTAQNINSGNALAVGYLLGTGAANTLKSKGGTADVLLNADAHTLQFDIAPISTGANSVSATYRYEFPLIIQLTDQKSYQFYGQYFDGIISDDTIYDAPTAAGRCRTLLTEQSFGLTTLKAQCWKSGIQSGMILKVVDSVRGINNSYIVQQVDTVPLGGGNFQYNFQLGAWNWNLVDVFMNSIKAAEAANIPNTSNNDDLSINAITISQMLESVGVHVNWSTSTKAAGGPFYARSAPVGDGHDSYPGFCTA